MRESGEVEHSRQARRASRLLVFIPGIVGIISALLTLSWPLFEKFEKVNGSFGEVLFPGLLFVLAVGEHWGFAGHYFVAVALLSAAAFNGILYCGLTWLAMILWRASFQ